MAISPGFKRVVAVRRVCFADGSTESLARFIEVPEVEVVKGMGALRLPETSEARAEACKRVALARARRELRWALISIGADHLLSCTFRENLADMREALKVWAYFIKLVAARYPLWKFAAVMELQERGAIHFHAGVKGFQDVKYLRTCWLRAAGDHGGNIDVQGQRRRWSGGGKGWNRRGLCSYMAKYLGKAFEWMVKGSRRFHASQNRVRPTIDRWWINYVDNDGSVVTSVYRLTCGNRAGGVAQWMSPDGGAYVVSCEGPPLHEPCPF